MKPATFLVGVTQPLLSGVKAYLEHTGQMQFYPAFEQYYFKNNNDPCCLVSLFAKLCYKSLVVGKNANISRVRDIEDNLRGVVESKHGSVFEHVNLNFITTNCSRVFTHELVRHRVGTAFSQTSGRYVALDKIDVVLPPELEPKCKTCGGRGWYATQQEHCPDCGGFGEPHHKITYQDGSTSEVGLQEIIGQHLEYEAWFLGQLRSMLIREGMSFDEKKRITSAIRRFAPNGQTNEIAWSINVRALRHILELRSSAGAEWEIRLVANQVYDLVNAQWPMMFYGGDSVNVDGLQAFTRLRI